MYAKPVRILVNAGLSISSKLRLLDSATQNEHDFVNESSDKGIPNQKQAKHQKLKKSIIFVLVISVQVEKVLTVNLF